MFNRWFLTDPVLIDLCLSYYHEKWLVVLSYAVAAFASYTAFHMIERIRSAPSAKIRLLWLAVAGTSMGSGIFAMHFIAMLAVRISVLVSYHIELTILSLVFAIVASAVAFHLAVSDDRNPVRKYAAPIVLGGGIGLMHYTGMMALRMPARINYDPYLFALSVVVAVVLSMMALYLLLHRNTNSKKSTKIWNRFTGALAMGIAVTAMHYTGMLATYFYPEPGTISTGATFDGDSMAGAVGLAAFVISSLAIILSLLDQRAAVAELERARTESFLQTVIDNSDDGILTFDHNWVVQTCNPEGARIFDHEGKNIVSSRFDELIEDGDKIEVTELNKYIHGHANVKRADNAACIIEYTIKGLQFGGRLLFTCIVRDITARKLGEQALMASQAHLQSVLDNIVEAVITISEDGCIESFNPAAEKLFGYSKEEAIGRNISMILPESDKTPQDGHFQASVSTGQGKFVGHGAREVVACRKNGTSVWISLSISEMWVGNIRKFIGAARDMTTKFEAQEALRASEERFRNMSANVPGFIYQAELGPDGSLSFPYISAGARDIFGVDAKAIMADGDELLNCLSVDGRNQLNDAIRASQETLRPWKSTLEINTELGEVKSVRFGARPRRLFDEQVVSDGFASDVSEEIRQVEEKRTLESRLRQAQKLEALGTLAGGTAHEFNNMLTPMIGLTQIAMREIPEDSRAHLNLTKVLENGKRAAQLVEKILSFGHKDENTDHQALNLVSVVQKVMELVDATLPATIEIRTEWDAEYLKIVADETQIHQVLMNLASNAAHAMQGRTGVLTVGLSEIALDTAFVRNFGTLEAGRYAKISLCDTGHGMDMKTIERIFEPFFTTKAVGEGTGLGLAMIHGIVTAYGGIIDVESEPGRGTTFDIFLPLALGNEDVLVMSS